MLSRSEKSLPGKDSDSCFFFVCRSVFCGGGRYSGFYPDEGGQTISGDFEHAATLPAPEGASRGRPHTIHVVVNDRGLVWIDYASFFHYVD